jgi:hypothetical protein
MITQGNLVVLRVGDGVHTAANVNTALPVTIDEFSVSYTGSLPTSVALVQSIPVQFNSTIPTSGNRNLGMPQAAPDGQLALSTNLQYMTFAGYNSYTSPDNTTVGGTFVNTVERVVGRLSLADGLVDTSTTVAGATAGTGSWRGAYTTNGTNIWTATTNGLRYQTLGTNSATVLNAAGVKRVYVYKDSTNTDRLYVMDNVTGQPSVRINTVGTGIPTSGSPAYSQIPPGSGTVGGNTDGFDFWFADANTVYVADQTGSGVEPYKRGGVQKWIFDGTNWDLAFSTPPLIATANNGGVRGLIGSTDGTNVTLFATTTWANGFPNRLYGLSDTIANTNPANMSQSMLIDLREGSGVIPYGNTNYSLRGMALAIPEPGSLSLFAIALAYAGARRGRSK